MDDKRIVKVLEVVDTRDWEEVADDKWRAIPGSGEERECDRCGRKHEVHATVLLADGSTAVVGTGCAKGETAMAKTLKSGASTAKTIAKLQRQLATARGRLDSALEIVEKVEALPLPEIAVSNHIRPEPWLPDGGRVQTATMGDASVWFKSGAELSDERKRDLVEQWRRNRQREMGLRQRPYFMADKVKHFERLLNKAIERLSNIMVSAD